MPDSPHSVGVNRDWTASPATASGNSGKLAGLSLLVVEDEWLVAMMLEDILRRLGCFAEMASSVPDAMAAVERKDLHGAILDVNIGGQPVYPVARRLATRGVPFVFTSAYTPREIDPAFTDVPLVKKPYTAGTVAQVLTGTFLPPDPAS